MPSTRAEIVLLVGPKGAGKSTIGRILGCRPGVRFLEVEAIAKRVLASMGGAIDEDYARRALQVIVREVESISGEHRLLVLETTGASDETPRFIDALRRAHVVRLVRVRARAELCAERIAARDAARHVEVPVELIRKMHEQTDALRLEWELDVVNDPALTEAQVLELFAPVLDERG